MPASTSRKASIAAIALAEIAGNRALTLFLDTLISLSDEYSRPELAKADPGLDVRMRDSHRTHIAIAKAVLARDPDSASRRMRDHLAAVSKWMPRP
jgi:DNA-binding FadR family transcriptional regulator